MSAPTARVGGFTRHWVWLYTLGLTAALRSERREEIDSDLWEQREAGWARGLASARIAASTLGRCLLGMPADLSWRAEQSRATGLRGAAAAARRPASHRARRRLGRTARAARPDRRPRRALRPARPRRHRHDPDQRRRRLDPWSALRLRADQPRRGHRHRRRLASHRGVAAPRRYADRRWGRVHGPCAVRDHRRAAGHRGGAVLGGQARLRRPGSGGHRGTVAGRVANRKISSL